MSSPVEQVINQILATNPQNNNPLEGYGMQLTRGNPQLRQEAVMFTRTLAEQERPPHQDLYNWVVQKLQYFWPYTIKKTQGSFNGQDPNQIPALEQSANYVQQVLNSAYQQNMQMQNTQQYGAPTHGQQFVQPAYTGPRPAVNGMIGGVAPQNVPTNFGAPAFAPQQQNMSSADEAFGHYKSGNVQNQQTQVNQSTFHQSQPQVNVNPQQRQSPPPQPSREVVVEKKESVAPQGNNYPEAFDARTHTQVNEGGVLKVLPIEEVGEMKYEDHELNVTARSNIPVANNGKVAPRQWIPSYSNTEKAKLPAQDRDLFQKLKTFETNFLAYNDNHVKVQIFKELAKQHVNVNDNFIEYSYTKITPYVVKGEVQETIDLVNQLQKSKSIDAFVNTLDDMIARNVDHGLIDMLIDRATKAMNRLLNIGLGLKASVDNLVEDWIDFKTGLRQHYGNEKYSTIMSEINSNKTQITLSSRLLSDEQKAKLAANEGLDQGLIGDKLESLFIFGEIVYVCRPNLTANDLSLNIKVTGSEVKESLLPGLYKGLSGISERALKRNADTIAVITTDNVEMHLNHGALSKGHLVLSLIK